MNLIDHRYSFMNRRRYKTNAGKPKKKISISFLPTPLLLRISNVITFFRFGMANKIMIPPLSSENMLFFVRNCS